MAHLRQRLLELRHEKSRLGSTGRDKEEGRASRTVGCLKIGGVCGSYSDTLSLLRDGSLDLNREGEGRRKKCLLWLGSSIANLDQAAATDFLRQFVVRDILLPGDTMLVGVDCCQDVDKVKLAYSEDSDKWKAYVENAMRNVSAALGGKAAQDSGECLSSWQYEARWDAVNSRHVVRGFSSPCELY